MKKGYAYIDKAEILHVNHDFQDAVEYAKKGSKVTEVEMEYDHGYPIHGGEEIIVYAEDDMRLEGGGAKIKVIPELATLHKACKN